MANGIEAGTLAGLKAARARYQTASGSGGSTGSLNLDLVELAKEVIELIDKIEKGIATEADKRRAEGVKSQLEYRSQELDFTAKMYESRSKNVRAQLDSRTKVLVARETAESRYNEKVRTTDSKLLVQVDTILGGMKGQDAIISSFDALLEPAAMPGDVRKPKIAPDDPKYGATLASMMVSLNDHNKAEIFAIDPVTKLVDITKTKNNLNNKITSGEEVGKIERWLQYYNASRRRRNQHEGDMARLIKQSGDLVTAAESALDTGDEEKAKILMNQFDELDQQRAALYSGFHSIKPKSDLDEIEASSRRRTGSLDSAKELLTTINAELGAGEVSSYKRQIAKAIANPSFRAWAADYGWDRLGQVQRNEQGELDLTTYVTGGDDIAALLEWGKQFKRRAGNYGLKRIRTGEVLRVELKDGTIVTGERLRRHASDPLGAIRIVQPDGARLVTPAEVSQAIYLKRPTPDPTRIDRRAKNIYDKDKRLYGSLEIEALGRGDFEDRADLYPNDEGLYAVNEAGEYLNRTQVSELRSAKYNASGYHAVKDDESGTTFIVAAEGNVYPLGAGFKLGPELTAEQAKAVRDKLPTSNDTRLMLKTDVGGFVSFDAEDLAKALVAGQMPEDTQVFGTVDVADKNTAGAALEQEQALITDTDIGLEFGSGPTGIDPTVLGEGVGDTGIFFRDLTEGEDFPLPDEAEEPTYEEKAVAEAVDEVAEKPFDETGALPPGEQPVGDPQAIAGSNEAQMDRFAQFTAEQRAQFPDLEAVLDAQVASGTRDAPKDYVKPEDRVATETPAKPEKKKTRRQKRRELRKTQKAATAAKKVPVAKVTEEVPEPKPDAVDTEVKDDAPTTVTSAETVTPTILKEQESESGEPKPGLNLPPNLLPSPLSPNQNAVDQFFSLPTSEQEKLTKAITSEPEPVTGTGIDNEDVKDAATKIVSALSRGREERKRKREEKKQKREEVKTDDASKPDPDATTSNLTVPTQVGTTFKGPVTDIGKGFPGTEENTEN